MTPVRIFAQIALPATLLFAGLTLSPSTSYAAGLSVFQPTTDRILGRDDANECTVDDRCAKDQGVKFDIAGGGGHDDPSECTVDDRCATDGPRTFDRG